MWKQVLSLPNKLRSHRSASNRLKAAFFSRLISCAIIVVLWEPPPQLRSQCFHRMLPVHSFVPAKLNIYLKTQGAKPSLRNDNKWWTKANVWWKMIENDGKFIFFAPHIHQKRKQSAQRKIRPYNEGVSVKLTIRWCWCPEECCGLLIIYGVLQR